MKIPAIPTEAAIEEWTLAYGKWMQAATAVWCLAMNRQQGLVPTEEQFLAAHEALDRAHERVKRAVDSL